MFIKVLFIECLFLLPDFIVFASSIAISSSSLDGFELVMFDSAFEFIQLESRDTLFLLLFLQILAQFLGTLTQFLETRLQLF